MGVNRLFQIDVDRLFQIDMDRSAASIWFEIWGVVDPGQKKLNFLGKFPKNFNFLGNFPKYFDFLENFPKNFDFFRQFHKKSIFQGTLKKISIFRQFHKKSRFSRKISQNFRVRFRQFHKKIDFSSQICEKFQFFSGNFIQNSDFSWQISEKYRFSRQKLAIYSYFWANYSISLQKSPLSNILPVHDKIHCIIIFYDPFTTPMTSTTTPAQNLGCRDPRTPRIDA